MRIGIYYYKNKNEEISKMIEQEAIKRGFLLDDHYPDVVFTVGGDGTFLRAVHRYMDILDEVHFIGINNGTLGFFYDYTKEDIPMLMDMLKNNNFKVKTHRLLKADVKYQSEVETIYAVNEIRIENPFHTLIANVSIDNQLLETFRGNGLMVCSPLGSSGYNKSLGGALLDQDLDVMELKEIAAIQNNIYRALGSPFVFSSDKDISFSGTFNGAVVGYDHLSLDKHDVLLKVDICCSDKTVKIIHGEDHSYINKVRKSFVL